MLTSTILFSDYIISSALETNSTGTVSIETESGDHEPLFEFDLSVVGKDSYAQGKYKKSGSYQLVISEDRFTFSIFDTQENQLVFIVGNKVVEAEEPSLFQRFGLQGLITLVFIGMHIAIVLYSYSHNTIGSQVMKAYIRGGQPEQQAEGEQEPVEGSEGTEATTTEGSSDKKND